ncbi:MAG: DMT family transporter [Rhizobiaceae bacterium]
MTQIRSVATIGIACAMVASTAFTLNDVGIKFLSGDYPLHQIVFFRTLVALALTLGVIIPLEGGFQLVKTRHLKMHLFRGLSVVCANMVFFMGLAALPLSEATAIFFISPLVITAFSVIFLAERVGLRRWIAVIAGLVGALVIIRPGTEAFQLAALLPALAAVAYATLHMLTRKIGRLEKASTMALYTHLTFLLVSSCVGLVAGDGTYATSIHPSIDFLTRPWVMPPTRDIWIMAGIGMASGTGGYFITQAYRTCEAALIAPFEYLALVLAIFWGVIIFSEWPDTWAWTGISMILGAGLFVIWREAVLKKRLALSLSLSNGPILKERICDKIK